MIFLLQYFDFIYYVKNEINEIIIFTILTK